MTVIATDNIVRVGNLVKAEYEDTRFTRKAMDVTVVEGMKVGAVLDTSGVLVTVANTANTHAVLVDDTVYDKAPGVHKMLVLWNGYALLADQALQYGADVDTDNEKNAVKAVLKAKNILTIEQSPA